MYPMSLYTMLLFAVLLYTMLSNGRLPAAPIFGGPIAIGFLRSTSRTRRNGLDIKNASMRHHALLFRLYVRGRIPTKSHRTMCVQVMLRRNGLTSKRYNSQQIQQMLVKEDVYTRMQCKCSRPGCNPRTRNNAGLVIIL